jgi:hypothetical protein
MSTKTTFKRIALVAVAALGFGMLSVVPSNAAPAGPAATVAAPWVVEEAQSDTGTVIARTATQIAGANNFVQLKGGATSTSTLSVLKVTGSTIAAFAGANAAANVAATEVTFGPVQSVTTGHTVNIATPTAGTVTAIWYTRVVLNGVPTDTEAQRITITVSALKTWSDRFSTATAAKAAGVGVAGTLETINAPKGTLNVAAVLVGSITMSFKDSADVALLEPTGEYPTVRATITGPGNIQFSGGGLEVARGRDITLVTEIPAPVLNIYNDGTGGKSTISIYVGGVLWKTKEVSFYGTVTTLTATQGLFVAPTTGGAHGCGAATLVTCDSTTVPLTPAATIAATDVNGIAVPFLTIGASSSDATVFASSTTSAETVATGTGSYNANVVAVPAGTSGKTAAITFRTLLADGVTYVSATPLTYAIGGSAASVTLDVVTTGKAGEKATVTLTKKDSAGNKAADKDHTVAFNSNTSVTSSIFNASLNTQTAGTSSQKVVNGAKTWDFFNPLVEAEVKFDITVDSLLTASASFAVGSTSAAATDLAAEALDAANAATDAANAAAEAADAATAAAQDAADAVAALATQVATYISNLRKQITALTNLVVKIQKKVKA